jgi:hypothetical protein
MASEIVRYPIVVKEGVVDVEEKPMCGNLMRAYPLGRGFQPTK